VIGCVTLLELYKKCKAPPQHRATVPLLIDPGDGNNLQPKLIGNESSDLIRILNNWPVNKYKIELAPEECNENLKSLEKIIQDKINDGVYRCGFARTQKAYDAASHELFEALGLIEKTLKGKGPWLCGNKITLADIILFPTLIRWEIIYEPLFKCSKESLLSFPNIIAWRKRLFENHLVEETCDSISWVNDYYGALFPLNPSNIVPLSKSLHRVINPPLGNL